ncbi:MAG: hypothetical protein ACRD2L_05045 [Terriglobia bacterium]
MRKTIGAICYVLGGAGGVLALQLLIGCELLGIFSRVENQRYEFWSFILVTNGHHLAYPNGYVVHLLRDFFVMLLAFLIIWSGRAQFVYRARSRTDKVELITCPGCNKKTYAEAYCRFCGFNLITHKPAGDRGLAMPVWKVSVLAYTGVSVLLLIINLLLRG